MSKHHANNEPEDYRWLIWPILSLAAIIFLCANGIGQHTVPSIVPDVIKMMGRTEYQHTFLLLISVTCLCDVVAHKLMKSKDEKEDQ